MKLSPAQTIAKHADQDGFTIRGADLVPVPTRDGSRVAVQYEFHRSGTVVPLHAVAGRRRPVHGVQERLFRGGCSRGVALGLVTDGMVSACLPPPAGASLSRPGFLVCEGSRLPMVITPLR